MYIACNDTSVIVINFRKSKTHAITDMYCNIFIQDCRKVKNYLSKATFLQKEREGDRIKGVRFFVLTCPGY